MKQFLIVVLSIALLAGNVPQASASAQSSVQTDDITGHYFESSIRTLIEKNVMSGYGEGIYKPNNAVTRSEFASLIVRALMPGTVKAADANLASQLTDLVPSAWYYSAVTRAVEMGIVGGYPDKTFQPEKEISRQEMAAMIMRAINTKSIYSEASTNIYQDTNSIHVSFRDSVQRLRFLGIMAGTDNKFNPNASTTRGEVAAVLLRMINIMNTPESVEPTITYTNYNITLAEMIQKQMSVTPQTDKYRNDKAFVSGDYIDNIREEGMKRYGDIVNTTFLNVREGASTDDRLVGRLSSILEMPTTVEILDEVINEKGEVWYEIIFGAWRNAKEEDVAYYVNPAKFPNTSKEYFQFLRLSRPAGITAGELNTKILAGKGILAGQGQAFIDAGKKYSVNEIYLVAHSFLETGEGHSPLATGIEVSSIVQRDNKGLPLLDENGMPLTQPVEPKTVYNVFGIGAIDSCPDECGAERAYNEGWFTPEAAIIGGAKFISEMYINNPTYKQDTLYKMRWNPATPTIHQYATDIGWAVKQVNRISEMYQLLDSYTLYYDYPVYK